MWSIIIPKCQVYIYLLCVKSSTHSTSIYPLAPEQFPLFSHIILINICKEWNNTMWQKLPFIQTYMRPFPSANCSPYCISWCMLLYPTYVQQNTPVPFPSNFLTKIETLFSISSFLLMHSIWYFLHPSKSHKERQTLSHPHVFSQPFSLLYSFSIIYTMKQSTHSISGIFPFRFLLLTELMSKGGVWISAGNKKQSCCLLCFISFHSLSITWVYQPNKI